MSAPYIDLSGTIVDIPVDSELVSEAEEELFFIYTALQDKNIAAVPLSPGLGYVDNRQDTLTIRIELQSPPNIRPLPDQVTRKSKRPNKGRAAGAGHDKILEIDISQDTTALRSRKGDTGSVVWRVSIAFAHLVLHQHHFPPERPFLRPDRLSQAQVLELGAGTGILSVSLAPLVKRYICTDLPTLIPLIRKNVKLNSASVGSCDLVVEPLDWQDILSCPPHSRARVFPLTDSPFDLVLALDCVYHPALIPAFVETIDYVTKPGHTVVIVVIELRAEDVVRAFLEEWSGRKGWSLWRVGGALLMLPYVMWVGWKTVNTSDI